MQLPVANRLRRFWFSAQTPSAITSTSAAVCNSLKPRGPTQNSQVAQFFHSLAVNLAILRLLSGYAWLRRDKPGYAPLRGDDLTGRRTSSQIQEK